MELINPYSEKSIGLVAITSNEEINLIVKAAKNAFISWSQTTGEERAVFLEKMAEEILARKSNLAIMETENCGKPIMESEWDMDDVAGCFKYYATLARDLDRKQNKSIDVGNQDYECCIRLEPAGVVGCIIPWNYPLLMAAWKVGPALASGCTVILKPSELTPLTAIQLGEIAAEVGLPHGVLNIVTGGRDTGKAVVEHPDIAVVAFTGSVPSGINVASTAAPHVKQVSLELGGKSAAIVFADADLRKAAEWVCFGCFWTNGQICSATSRLLVEASVKDEFIKYVKAIVALIQMGDPMEKSCRLGPVVSKQQRDKIYDMVQQSLKQGAVLECGTGVAPKQSGYFVEPTILHITNPDTVAWKEEIFGPVLSFMTFTSEASAIEMANNSKYGLAAAVFSSDMEKVTRCTNQLEVGIVWQNTSQPCFPQLPWGGRKQSGYSRDLGEYGLAKFLEPKQIVKYVSKEPLGWYPSASV